MCFQIRYCEVAEETIVSYDRGWEIYPETEEGEAILEAVLLVLTV